MGVSVTANPSISTRPAPLTNSVFKFYWGIMRPFRAGPGPLRNATSPPPGTEWRPGIWVLQPKQNSSGIINGVLSVTKRSNSNSDMEVRRPMPWNVARSAFIHFIFYGLVVVAFFNAFPVLRYTGSAVGKVLH